MKNKFDDLLDQFGYDTGDLNDTTLVDKNYLKELKHKAKAFDAILNIEDDFVKYHGFYPCVEEYAEEVEEIISEYTEDKQND